MKQTVSIEIAGQVLSIRSDEGPEYVQELAEYVDAHLRELGGGRRPYSRERVALLVAMKIADELFREKDLRQRYRAKVEARLEALEVALAAHEAQLSALERSPVGEKD